MRFTTIAIVTIASAAMAATVPAQAGQSRDYEFKINAYDLETSSGIVRAHESLERQVGRFCEQPGRRSLTERRIQEECITNVMDDVIAKIGSRTLSSYHQASPALRYSAK